MQSGAMCRRMMEGGLLKGAGGFLGIMVIDNSLIRA
jgi:hypothetical protein